MRINKCLAECGVASRRAADKMIIDGEVKINGRICSLGDEVNLDDDNVTVNGKTVSTVKKYDYYILNKPKGYVCTVRDDKGRKTVMDLLPPNVKRVFPVGRLDYDSEGLLIMTNDGELTYRLTHPKNEIPKTYLVKLEGTITDEALNKVKNGVVIDGKRTGKCNIKVVEQTRDAVRLHITITEGRNRQVRKMFLAVGKEVKLLKRIKVGELTLRGLDRGEVRKLTAEEVEYLMNL